MRLRVYQDGRASVLETQDGARRVMVLYEPGRRWRGVELRADGALLAMPAARARALAARVLYQL